MHSQHLIITSSSKAPERGRGVQQHATSSMLFASSTVNTGSFLKGVKGSGKEGRETPTKPRCLRKWRMGRRSRSVGKPRTRGRGLMAKAPSLGEYGVQRSGANNVPSERASCALAVR